MLKDTLIQFIGTYVPQSGDGFGSVDWAWVLSALLLIIFVYSLIRFLGGLLRVK